MTKEELFKKYNIEESHSKWDDKVDNWMSVEVFRLMHDGELPKQDDTSVMWVCDFLDKFRSDGRFKKKIMSRGDWGSLYLTAKRMVYSFSEEILKALKEK